MGPVSWYVEQYNVESWYEYGLERTGREIFVKIMRA